ncbi:MAG: FUSC family protein [Propionibacteriaceae bacterium]
MDWHPLVRPTGGSSWVPGLLLGGALAGVLVTGVQTGLVDLAARSGLGVILVALPSLPATAGEVWRTLGARTLAVLVGAAFVVPAGGRPGLVVVGVLLAAAVGAFLPRVRVCAALAVLLCGVRAQADAPDALPLVGEGAGALAVCLVGFLGALLARPNGPPPRGPTPAPSPPRSRLAEDAEHGLRMVLGLVTAFAVVAVSGLGLAGGHWLVTAVLLSLQRTGTATRLRVAQRLVGNTAGALLVALIMATGASGTVLGLVAAGGFCVAFALRPINYLWWAVAAPPVLLIIGDFPQAHSWYEGAVRVGLGVVGALIVWIVFRLTRRRWVRRA